MATIKAKTGGGNWDAGATWIGGVKPGASDTGDINGQPVTLNEVPACASIIDSAGGGLLTMLAGGYYTVNTLTVSCAVTQGADSRITIGTAKTLTIAGTWTTISNSRLLHNASTSKLVIANGGNWAHSGYYTPVGSTALTVQSGGTWTWTPGANGNIATSAGVTFVFDAGSIVTLCGQRVYPTAGGSVSGIKSGGAL